MRLNDEGKKKEQLQREQLQGTVENCRICGGGIKLVQVVKESRYGSLSKGGAMPFDVEKRNLPLFYCESCNFYQAPYIYDSDYYQGDYSEQGGFAQYYSGNSVVKKKLLRLYEYCQKQFPEKEINYLEVGCGIGASLKLAEDVFDYTVGVEPSDLGFKAEKNGMNIIHDFFGEALGITEEYSSIASFMVFEHLENPLEILKSIREALKPNGIAFINVPNGSTIMHNRLYHQVICEHINYFSAESFYELASRAGFKVIEIRNDADNFEYDVYLQKDEQTSPDINAKKEQDRKEIQKYISKYENITIWGAGAKANIFSEFLPDDGRVKHLVDGDESKEGLYVSGINIPIEKVRQPIIEGSDLILIFAAQYTDDIIDRLVSEFKYKRDILRFDRRSLEIQSLK